MNDEKFSQLNLKSIVLRSLSFNKAAKTLPDVGTNKNEMNLNLQFHSIRKYYFSVNLVVEILYQGSKFKVKYVADFKNSNPTDKPTLDTEDFHKKILEILLPFNTSIFSYISEKSFGKPIIIPPFYFSEEKKAKQKTREP